MLDDILNDGQLVKGAKHYRNVPYREREADGSTHVIDVAEPVNFSQAGWPGNRATEYAECADALAGYARTGAIPWHVVVSEILRAIDCRLTEYLYFTALYPETDWIHPKRSLPFWRKTLVASHILPARVLPQALIHDLQTARNNVEHQFASVDNQSALRYVDTMHLFLQRSTPLLGVLEQGSLFQYRLPDSDQSLYLQLDRRHGRVILFRDEYREATATVISGHSVAFDRDESPEKALLQRLLTTLDTRQPDPWEFFDLGTPIPEGLGPDDAPFTMVF